VPSPVTMNACGLPNLESVILILPVRVPLAVGENVTGMSQLPPAGTLAPQVLDDSAWNSSLPVGAAQDPDVL